MTDKTTGQDRQDRLNAALRANLKRRKQQGRGRGATALPLEEREGLMNGNSAEKRPSLMNGDAEKSADDGATNSAGLTETDRS